MRDASVISGRNEGCISYKRRERLGNDMGYQCQKRKFGG